MSERADLYFSLDIEADGPIPGRYSMLAFGLAVAARFDGTTFEKRDPAADTFYRELQPISEEFDTAALEVSDLDRSLLLKSGAEPASAMTEAAAWIENTAGRDRPACPSPSVPRVDECGCRACWRCRPLTPPRRWPQPQGQPRRQSRAGIMSRCRGDRTRQIRPGHRVLPLASTMGR